MNNEKSQSLENAKLTVNNLNERVIEMENMEFKNATITGTKLGFEHGILTGEIFLLYEHSIQAFGGICLYNPSYKGCEELSKKDIGGSWVFGILKVLAVQSWEELVGINVRVSCNSEFIQKIGHIIKDQWFSAFGNSFDEHKET